jgi:hypothetical protein
METFIELDMLFEPRIKPSQLLELDSLTEKRFNGYYKVVGITHKGTISGATSGSCTTTLQMITIKEANVIMDQGTQEYQRGEA